MVAAQAKFYSIHLAPECSIAFHAFFSAMFPVRQEVSPASCHSPLSCGHFLMFCQCLSVLLTQSIEVALRQKPEKSFDDLWLRELTFAGPTMCVCTAPGHILRSNCSPLERRPVGSSRFDVLIFEGKVF